MRLISQSPAVKGSSESTSYMICQISPQREQVIAMVFLPREAGAVALVSSLHTPQWKSIARGCAFTVPARSWATRSSPELPGRHCP